MAPGIALSAYRIVQEALSNVLRHAPGAPIDVLVEFEGRQMQITVTNGPPSQSARHIPPGVAPADVEPACVEPAAVEPADVASEHKHGLLGMRERTRMLGGALSVGPTDDMGFQVKAVLPLEEA